MLIVWLVLFIICFPFSSSISCVTHHVVATKVFFPTNDFINQTLSLTFTLVLESRKKGVDLYHPPSKLVSVSQFLCNIQSLLDYNRLQVVDFQHHTNSHPLSNSLMVTMYNIKTFHKHQHEKQSHNYPPNTPFD